MLHKDAHGDDMVISKDKTGRVWVVCNEYDNSVTELCFSKSTVKEIIEDLQEQIKEEKR